MFEMRELLDTLSFLLCLWKDRLPCHFSMGLGRQTSVLFCKATLQDRLVCGFFMLIGIKCYMDGDRKFTDLLWKCQNSFLDIVSSFAESVQGLKQAGSNSQSQSTRFQSIESWSKEVFFSDPWILYKTQECFSLGWI